MTERQRLLLNCDLAELDEIDDQWFMPHLDIANIACGGHAGGAAQMQRAVALAKHYGVAIAAHPSYPDRAHFGRRSLALSEQELAATIAEQLNALNQICREHAATIRYVKPHGALYHDILQQPAVAICFLKVVQAVLPECTVIVQALPGCHPLAAIAESLSLPLLFEGFADRQYQDDGRLLPRHCAGALLTNITVIRENISRYCQQHVWPTQSGVIALNLATLCVHSDTRSSVQLVESIAQLLRNSELSPLAPCLTAAQCSSGAKR